MIPYSRMLELYTVIVHRPAKKLVELIESGNDGGCGEYDEFLPAKCVGDYDIPVLVTVKGKKVVAFVPLMHGPSNHALAIKYVEEQLKRPH